MFRNFPKELLVAVRITLVIAVLGGLIYPLVMLGVSQVAFNSQANGGLIKNSSGTEVVMPLNPPCESNNSQGSNLAPSNALLIEQVDTYAGYLHCVGIDTAGSFTAAQLQQAVTDPSAHCLSSGATTTPIPVDLATGDFTSYDPDISVAAALAQVNMVAEARGLDPARVHAVVEANITGRVLWIFGESDVDVLQLNIAMDKAFGTTPALG